MFFLEFVIAATACVLSIVALNKAGLADQRLRNMNMRLGEMLAELERLRGGKLLTPAAEVVEPAKPIEEPVVAAAAVAPSSEPASAGSKTWNAARAELSPPVQPELEAVPREAAHARPGGDVERNIASRWFAWIGGVAIAIAGILFVKYAHDNGLLPPGLRVAVGLIAGLLLVGVAEYLRRKPLAAIADKTFVPAALSAGGLLIAFGSVFAGYALYAIFSPFVAFGLMALIALAAIALSLVQGPFIGALGLIGAYTVPALVSTGNPDAWTFFPYLLIVMTASLLILRARTWWWLGLLAVLGGLGWSLLWTGSGIFEAADTLPVGLFALATGALGLFAVSGRSMLSPGSGNLWQPSSVTPPLWIGLTALAAMMIALGGLAINTGHATLAIALLAAGAAATSAVAVAKPELDLLAPIVALLSLLVLVVWREASFFELAMDERGLWSAVAGPDQKRYLAWVLAFGLAFAALAIEGLKRLQRLPVWAGLLAGGLVLFGFAAWARVPDALSDTVWAVGGAGVTIILAGIAYWIKDRQGETARDLAIGILAASAGLAALFAFDRLFDRASLTLALSLIPLAYGLAVQRLRNPYFGWCAVTAAAFVAIRLFTAQELWSAEGGLFWGQHWIVYGYGVPIVLFWIASRLFAKTGDRAAQVSLEGGALGLAVALVSLELRVLIAGGVTENQPGLLEAAAHALAWLAAAYGLAYRQSLVSGVVSLWGGRLLIAVGVALLVLGPLLIQNPVVTEDLVAGGPYFNAILLAYFAPAVLIGLLAQKLDGFGWERLRPVAGILALVLWLTYVTLQVKRLFEGQYLTFWPVSVAENYTHSAAWLLTALGLFVAGLRFGRAYLRYAGLAVMVLVTLKVFLWDLAGLDGLYQIASLMGLGLCLVGIAFLYTRFVQLPQAKTPAAP